MANLRYSMRTTGGAKIGVGVCGRELGNLIHGVAYCISDGT